jgi:hypothetical protein
MRTESFSVDVTFATEYLIAIYGEIVKEVFWLSLRFLNESRYTGFERIPAVERRRDAASTEPPMFSRSLTRLLL